MTLDYGNYGIFLIMGNAGYIYISSTVSARLDRVLVKSRRLGRPWKGDESGLQKRVWVWGVRV